MRLNFLNEIKQYIINYNVNLYMAKYVDRAD